MKSLSILKFLCLIGLAVFLMPSCLEDETGGGGTGGGGATGPSTSLLADTDVLSEDATVDAGAAFSVRLQALAGEGDLTSLTIYEDGFQIDPSRIVSIETVDVPNNPQVVTGDAVGGFTWTITLTAHAEGTLGYEFEVTDANAITSSASINITVASEPLTISFDNGDGAVTGVGPGLFAFPITAGGGANGLASIAVYEDGTLISDLSRLRYKDTAVQFDSNPQPFPAEDQAGFMGTIYVSLINGAHTLTFEVTDGSGTTVSADKTYNAGTPVSEIIGVLLNAGGPSGTGGLDLDTGDGTGSMDAAAEIRDQGIDSNQTPDVNWIQRIAATNNATLRVPDFSALPEGFSYGGVTTAEEITSVFDTGITVAESDMVQVGDIFAVERDGNYYLLLTTDVQVKATDNTDFYEFSIKQ